MLIFTKNILYSNINYKANMRMNTQNNIVYDFLNAIDKLENETSQIVALSTCSQNEHMLEDTSAIINCLQTILRCMNEESVSSKIVSLFMEKGCLNTFLVLFELKYLGDHKVALGLMMILNAICNIKDEHNFNYQNRICMIGFLPYIFELGKEGNNIDIRVEVTYNIGLAFINKNIESIQMIIAAGGLSTIVSFFDVDIMQHFEIIALAVDSCISVLDIKYFNEEDIIMMLLKLGYHERLACILNFLQKT